MEKYEAPKLNNVENSNNQLDMFDLQVNNVENQNNQLRIFDLQKVLNDIDIKYPHAKINPSIVEGDKVNGYFVKNETLEEYAKSLNELYRQNDNSDQYNH